MNPEKSKNNFEKIEKEKVFEMLKTNGFDHLETRDLILRWTKQREEEVENENTKRANIIFNIEQSDLYIIANDKEIALDYLEEALTQAEQEREVDLQKEILEKMKLTV